MDKILEYAIGGATGGIPLLIYLYVTFAEMREEVKKINEQLGQLQVKVASTEYLERQINKNSESIDRLDRDLKNILVKVGGP